MFTTLNCDFTQSKRVIEHVFFLTHTASTIYFIYKNHRYQ